MQSVRFMLVSDSKNVHVPSTYCNWLVSARDLKRKWNFPWNRTIFITIPQNNWISSLCISIKYGCWRGNMRKKKRCDWILIANFRLEIHSEFFFHSFPIDSLFSGYDFTELYLTMSASAAPQLILCLKKAIKFYLHFAVILKMSQSQCRICHSRFIFYRKRARESESQMRWYGTHVQNISP